MRIAFLLQEERCCSLSVCVQVHEYADWLFPERDRPPHENVHLLQPGGKLHFRFTAFGSWGDDWVSELLHALERTVSLDPLGAGPPHSRKQRRLPGSEQPLRFDSYHRYECDWYDLPHRR